MSKDLTVKTKLSRNPSPKAATHAAVNLAYAPKAVPRSYRWRVGDLELMESLRAKVNAISGRPIDTTKLIRGALFLAKKQSPDEILQSIMEAEAQSLQARESAT